MATAEEKRIVALLRKVPVLADASTEGLIRLGVTAKLGNFRPRQVVYLPGDRAEGVFFVAAGRVKVSKVTRDGKELTLAYHVVGDFFGEAALLDGSPREEMAESMELTSIVEVERATLEKMLSTSVAVAHRFARSLIAKRRDLENKMEQIIFKDVGSKLSEILLSGAAEHGVAHAKGTLIALKITHQEIANLIGSTRETVSLTISQFKRRGLIANEGRRLIVVDREGLRALI